MSHPAIFFLSDYGRADEFVGVVHAVVQRAAPTVPVIDLSHEVAPFDITAGAAMLNRAAPYLGPGVVLAVVDPGVGSKRRPIALKVAGDGPNWLVGPDNGLLVEASQSLGGVVAAYALDPGKPALARIRRHDAGSTFDGRDVFAPAASHLALGGEPTAIGAPVGADGLVVLTTRYSTPGRGRGMRASSVSASVSWVDRFGNVQLELLPSELDDADGLLRVAFESAAGAVSVSARRVRAFSDLGPGEFGLLVDSTGRLTLVLDQVSAADRLGAEVGTVVQIGPDEERHH